jgi:hypothetical protein
MTTIPQVPESNTNYAIKAVMPGWKCVPVLIHVYQRSGERRVDNLSGDPGNMIESQKRAVNNAVLWLKQSQDNYEQAIAGLLEHDPTLTVEPLEYIDNPTGEFGMVNNPEHPKHGGARPGSGRNQKRIVLDDDATKALASYLKQHPDSSANEVVSALVIDL